VSPIAALLVAAAAASYGLSCWLPIHSGCMSCFNSMLLGDASLVVILSDCLVPQALVEISAQKGSFLLLLFGCVQTAAFCWRVNSACNGRQR
jgi:hypothetical protein